MLKRPGTGLILTAMRRLMVTMLMMLNVIVILTKPRQKILKRVVGMMAAKEVVTMLGC